MLSFEFLTINPMPSKIIMTTAKQRTMKKMKQQQQKIRRNKMVKIREREGSEAESGRT